jgi:hypothetical protein
MEFTDDQLTRIIQMGAEGDSYTTIASELGLTYTFLEEERKTNPGLDAALSKAMRNFKLYYIDAIIESSKGKNLSVLLKALDMLNDMEAKGSPGSKSQAINSTKVSK